MKEPTEKQKKEFNKFADKQLEIVRGHFDRCLLRCFNKMMEMGK